MRFFFEFFLFYKTILFFATSVRVVVQDRDPDTGITDTTTHGMLEAGKTITIDLSAYAKKDRSRVRIAVVAGGNHYYSRSFFYYNNASKTRRFKYTSDGLTEV